MNFNRTSKTLCPYCNTIYNSRYYHLRQNPICRRATAARLLHDYRDETDHEARTLDQRRNDANNQ